jgi:hypothetical protein
MMTYTLGFFLNFHVRVTALRIAGTIVFARPWPYARQEFDNTALVFVTFT